MEVKKSNLSGLVALDDDSGGELSRHFVRPMGFVPGVAADAAFPAVLGLNLNQWTC